MEQESNSLDAQRESAENYIASQRANGWICLPERYDDGGFSGGNMARPALKRLLDDAAAGLIDSIIVYKIERVVLHQLGAIFTTTTCVAMVHRAYKVLKGKAGKELTMQEIRQAFTSLELIWNALFPVECGSPRKLDNLHRCKMACKLKQKGPFYEEVLRQQIQEPRSA